MRFLVETGRFILTALAVALAGQTVVTILELSSGSVFSIESFLGFGTIIFVLTIIGGVIAGLPALYLARRHGWDHRIGRMLLVGLLTGAIAGALLAIPFWAEDLAFSFAPIGLFAIFGGFAGVVAAPVWVLLHRSDTGTEPA